MSFKQFSKKQDTLGKGKPDDKPKGDPAEDQPKAQPDEIVHPPVEDK